MNNSTRPQKSEQNRTLAIADEWGELQRVQNEA